LGFRQGLSLEFFTSFRKGVFRLFGKGPGSPITVTVQDYPVGPVAESVQGGGAKEPVGESLPPLEEIELLVWLDPPFFREPAGSLVPEKVRGFSGSAGLTKVAGIVTGPTRV